MPYLQQHKNFNSRRSPIGSQAQHEGRARALPPVYVCACVRVCVCACVRVSLVIAASLIIAGHGCSSGVISDRKSGSHVESAVTDKRRGATTFVSPLQVRCESLRLLLLRCEGARGHTRAGGAPALPFAYEPFTKLHRHRTTAI